MRKLQFIIYKWQASVRKGCRSCVLAAHVAPYATDMATYTARITEASQVSKHLIWDIEIRVCLPSALKI